jgi:DNA-binding response OmpR family regulator
MAAHSDSLTKILCIDDDPAFGRVVCGRLERQGFVARHVRTGSEGLAVATSHVPSLVLLGGNLRGRPTALDVCHELATLAPKTGVIFLADRSYRGDAVRVLNAGADDYVEKPFEPDFLGARIRSLLRRLTSSASLDEHNPNVLQCGLLRLLLIEHIATVDEAKAHVTPWQERMLARLMRAAGEVVSNDDLWQDSDLGGTPRLPNIRAHVHALRRQLEPLGVSIRTWHGHGYSLEFVKKN